MKKTVALLAVLLAITIAGAFPRKPVLEVISATWCGWCGVLHADLDGVYSAVYNESVIIDYIDDTELFDSIETRPYCSDLFFGVNPDEVSQAYPAGGIDGQYGFVGAVAGQGIVDLLHELATTEITPVGLWFEAVTPDSVVIGVTVDADSGTGDYRLYVNLLESGVIIDGTAIAEYNWTTRDMLTGIDGLSFSIALGDTTYFTIPYTIDAAWDTNRIEFAAFVRNADDYVIRQGAKTAPCYFLTASPTMPYMGGNIGTELVCTLDVSNFGRNVDTIRVRLDGTAPATWTISGCTDIACFSRNGWMEVPPGMTKELTIHFLTTIDEPGSGICNVSLTSAGSGAVKQIPVVAGTYGHVLIVDDDGGVSYEEFYTNALDFLGDSTHIVMPSNAQFSKKYLDIFDFVIWITGTEYAGVLKPTDLAILREYLDDNGKLFLSGFDVCWDLVQNEVDPEFANDYLKTTWDESMDSATSFEVAGISGNPLWESLSLNLVGGDGADDASYPDILTPIGGAEPILYYGSGTSMCAGLTYRGSYQLIYFGFGFESINSADTRNATMQSVLNWFAAGIDDNKTLPVKIGISAAPNPFNAATRIEFSVPATATLSICDISGKTVFRNEISGKGSLVWRAENLGSGVYFAKINYGNVQTTTKLVLVK
jgi:hypothetical protein